MRDLIARIMPVFSCAYAATLLFFVSGCVDTHDPDITHESDSQILLDQRSSMAASEVNRVPKREATATTSLNTAYSELDAANLPNRTVNSLLESETDTYTNLGDHSGITPQARWSRADALADLALAKGESDDAFNDAEAEYKLAIKELTGPAKLAALNNYVSLLLIQERGVEAKELLEPNIKTALEMLQGRALSAFLFNYGRSLEETGFVDQALLNYQAAYEAEPRLGAAGKAVVAMLLENENVGQSIVEASNWIHRIISSNQTGRDFSSYIKPLLLESTWRKNDNYPLLIVALLHYISTSGESPSSIDEGFSHLLLGLPESSRDFAREFQKILHKEIDFVFSKQDIRQSFPRLAETEIFGEGLISQDFANWVWRLGDSYSNDDNVEFAAKRYALAWSANPDVVEPAVYLADLFLEKEEDTKLTSDIYNRFDNAIRDYSVSGDKQQSEEYARLNFLMGQLSEERSEYSEALNYYERALGSYEIVNVGSEQEKRYPVRGILAKIGQLNMQLSKFDAAERAFRSGSEEALDEGDVEIASDLFAEATNAERANLLAKLDDGKVAGYDFAFWHKEGVRRAVFDASSKRLVTVSNDRTARIWNITTGEITVELRGHEEIVRDAAFSPDGNSVATASDDGRVLIWDVASGKQTKSLTPSDDSKIGKFKSVSFNPVNPEQLVSATDDGSVLIWDVVSGQVLNERSIGGDSVRDAIFDEAGKVVTASWDGTVRRWNLETNEVDIIWTFEPEQVAGWKGWVDLISASVDQGRADDAMSEIFGPFLSPNLDKIAVVSTPPNEGDKQIVYVENAAEGITGDNHVAIELDRSLSQLDNIVWVEFSQDGKRIVTAAQSGKATVWNAENGRSLGYVRHEEPLKSAAFSPNGNYLITTSSDQSARMWSMKNILASGSR